VSYLISGENAKESTVGKQVDDHAKAVTLTGRR
jgi:hypothetical protein